jgi:hypothetical protein
MVQRERVEVLVTWQAVAALDRIRQTYPGGSARMLAANADDLSNWAKTTRPPSPVCITADTPSLGSPTARRLATRPDAIGYSQCKI